MRSQSVESASRRGGVDGGQIGLDAVRRRARRRAGEQVQRLADGVGVPPRAVLVLQRDQLAVDDAGGPPGVLQQHQRQQPPGLVGVGHQLDEQPTEPDRLGGQLVVGRRRVSLGEHEVDHGEHAVEAFGERLDGRDAVRDAGVGDLLLGPQQPLAHRVLGREEDPSDRRRREVRDHLQRQRDPGLHRQRRVAAGEHEAEPIVGDRLRRSGGLVGPDRPAWPPRRAWCVRCSCGGGRRWPAGGPWSSATPPAGRGCRRGASAASARSAASATASSASSQSPVVRISVATMRSRSAARASASARWTSSAGTRRVRHAVGPPGSSPQNGRSSSRPNRAIGCCDGDLDRLVEVGALEDVEAGDPLPRLGERPVGHEHLPAAHAHGRGVGDRPQRVADDPGAAGVVALDPVLDVVELRVTGRRIGFGVGADEHHVLHRGLLRSVDVVHHHDGRGAPDPTTRRRDRPAARSIPHPGRTVRMWCWPSPGRRWNDLRR